MIKKTEVRMKRQWNDKDREEETEGMRNFKEMNHRKKRRGDQEVITFVPH
jgi:hypothetical protein